MFILAITGVLGLMLGRVGGVMTLALGAIAIGAAVLGLGLATPATPLDAALSFGTAMLGYNAGLFAGLLLRPRAPHARRSLV